MRSRRSSNLTNYLGLLYILSVHCLNENGLPFVFAVLFNSRFLDIAIRSDV